MKKCHDVGPESYTGPHAPELCTCTTPEQARDCPHCRDEPTHIYSVLRAIGF